MKKAEICTDLENATLKLLEMADQSCYNKISANCEFILSEINDDKASNFFEETKLRIAANSTKTPVSLISAVNELEEVYADLYDVNLYIFHAKRDKTIIDIRYFLKSKLDIDYQKEVIDAAPMLHCKISIPPYHCNNESKYDVNWELGGIRVRMKIFFWRAKNRSKNLLN